MTELAMFTSDVFLSSWQSSSQPKTIKNSKKISAFDKFVCRKSCWLETWARVKS